LAVSKCHTDNMETRDELIYVDDKDDEFPLVDNSDGS
jgi:hypothetical protein